MRWCWLIWCCMQGRAQPVHSGQLAESARGGLVAAVPAWAYPAALGIDPRPATMIIFGEQIYFTDLSVFRMAYNGKLGEWPYSISWGRDGNKVMYQDRLSLAVSKKVSEAIHIGMRLGYAFDVAGGYGSSGRVIAGIGAAVDISPTLSWKLQFDGLESVNSESLDPNLLLRTALFGRISKVLGCSVELITTGTDPPTIITGIHYNSHDRFYSRLGFATHSRSMLFSEGLRMGNTTLEISAAYHLSLGASMGLMLTQNLKRQ